MADDADKRDPADAARARARLVSRLWVGLGLLGASAGFVTLSAAASLVAQNYEAAAVRWFVCGLALALSFGVPLMLGNGLVRLIAARGYQPARLPIYATSMALVNVIYAALLQFSGPQPVDRLWRERGTWAFDALTAQGPYGPAAEPVVLRALDQALGARTVKEAAPLWCDADAGAFAVGLASAMAKAGPALLTETLTDVVQAGGAKLDELPPADIDGRGLLGDVWRVVQAQFPPLDLAPPGGVDPDVSTIARTEIALHTPGWVARYEDGAWRWCPGTTEEFRTRGEEYAAALRDQARRVPIASAVAAGPWDGEVRAAVQQAIRGRTAWLAGAPAALEKGWADALTRAGALAQAEHLRGWCLRWAGKDMREVMEAFEKKWSLPEGGGRLKQSTRSLLEGQGRQYLADVVETCRPVVAARVEREKGQGIDVPEAQRQRWAEDEARVLAGDAKLTEEAQGVVGVEVDGRKLRAVQEDGAWRVDWQE